MNRVDVESFFKTLILGDFEEQQSTSAQLVGGLISLIPVLDQVMDVRDISGALFRINRKGGFKYASTDQVVNLGFAAFGAIPEVGSAFKTVFKPLWKERRAAKGAVHSGLNAIEGLLGQKKGGAIAWVRQELLGKWTSRTNEAIVWVETALASCIALMEFLANASGWKDWLIPDPIQAMAKELLPPLKDMHDGVGEVLQRASNEVREFLEDLLGEQAAAVVMAVGQRAAVASAVPATRTRTGHNAADVHPKGNVPARQPEKRVQSAPAADAKRSNGPIHTAIQVTRKAFGKLASQEKGLIGEHVVDYHEADRLKGRWPHDQPSGAWSPSNVAKINADRRPVNISLLDLPKVNQPGLDAVWKHDGKYTVTEAKASESIGAAYGFGKFKERKGLIPIVTGLNPDQQLLHYLLSDSSDKNGTQSPMMQMGTAWVEDRAKKEGLPPGVASDLSERNATKYERRTLFVTFEAKGAPDHAQALLELQLGKTGAELLPHTDHGITREWDATAIDAVGKARTRAHEAKRAAATGTGDKGSKPARTGQGKKP